MPGYQGNSCHVKRQITEKERIKKKERAKEVKGIKRKKEMMENPNDCNVSEI